MNNNAFIVYRFNGYYTTEVNIHKIIRKFTSAKTIEKACEKAKKLSRDNVGLFFVVYQDGYGSMSGSSEYVRFYHNGYEQSFVFKSEDGRIFSIIKVLEDKFVKYSSEKPKYIGGTYQFNYRASRIVDLYPLDKIRDVRYSLLLTNYFEDIHATASDYNYEFIYLNNEDEEIVILSSGGRQIKTLPEIYEERKQQIHDNAREYVLTSLGLPHIQASYGSPDYDKLRDFNNLIHAMGIKTTSDVITFIRKFAQGLQYLFSKKPTENKASKNINDFSEYMVGALHDLIEREIEETEEIEKAIEEHIHSK